MWFEILKWQAYYFQWTLFLDYVFLIVKDQNDSYKGPSA